MPLLPGVVGSRAA
jgi:hypothetical protein